MLALLLQYYFKVFKFNFPTERELIFRVQTIWCDFPCKITLDLLSQRKPVALDNGGYEPEGTLVLKSCGPRNHAQSVPQNRAFIQKDRPGVRSSAHTWAFLPPCSSFHVLSSFVLFSSFIIKDNFETASQLAFLQAQWSKTAVVAFFSPHNLCSQSLIILELIYHPSFTCSLSG